MFALNFLKQIQSRILKGKDCKATVDLIMQKLKDNDSKESYRKYNYLATPS